MDGEDKKENIEFPVTGTIAECPKCKRKMLVERALFGVNHTFGLHITCWDCLDEESKERAKKRYKLQE
ncbi:MAG: hypothetical protein AB1393_08720 [Candidatus Edwardsbacteria bacterium]